MVKGGNISYIFVAVIGLKVKLDTFLEAFKPSKNKCENLFNLSDHQHRVGSIWREWRVGLCSDQMGPGSGRNVGQPRKADLRKDDFWHVHGELIRQVLVDLMKDDLIFFEANREKILERGKLLF